MAQLISAAAAADGAADVVAGMPCFDVAAEGAEGTAFLFEGGSPLPLDRLDLYSAAAAETLLEEGGVDAGVVGCTFGCCGFELDSGTADANNIFVGSQKNRNVAADTDDGTIDCVGCNDRSKLRIVFFSWGGGVFSKYFRN